MKRLSNAMWSRARGLNRAIALLALVGFSAVAQAPGDVRVALVIGNSAYAGDAALANPANDAAAMAAVLRRLGFTVLELRNGSRAQMAEAIASMGNNLRGKQAVGMLYYAGHGLQLDWRNYMVPVDAKLNTAADVTAQAVNIDSVIAAFKASGNRMNIVVLDACRDNPFAGTGSAKGLAQLDAPTGTFLAYATAPGNVAEDGVGGSNGLYTGFLVQELQRPAARIEDVFKRVRLQVRQQSQGRQIPWESTSLEEDFFFNGAIKPGPKDPSTPAAPGREPVATDAAEAQAFALEKAAWDRIAASRNPDDFYEFLKKYPSGSISELATATLEGLAVARIDKVANKEGVVQVGGRDRFRKGDAHIMVVRDGLSNKVMRKPRLEVTAVTQDTVQINNGENLLTREGGLIRNRFIANMDPPRLDLPASDYVIGKKWSFRSIETHHGGGKTVTSGDVRVVALEDVTVPSGTFKAYRLELTSSSDDGKRVKLTRWMQPDWGFPIKLLREIRVRSGPPTLENWEMIGRQRGAA